MTCKDCYHYDMCSYEWCDSEALTFCKDFKDKSRIIELPFIAMIEQYLVNGKFADNIHLQKFNGCYATVYIDKNKWGTPLIDICGKDAYNTDEAEERLNELKERKRNNGYAPF